MVLQSPAEDGSAGSLKKVTK